MKEKAVAMKHKLKFLLEQDAGPLWAGDAYVEEKYGYLVDDLKSLGLSDATADLAEYVSQLYNSKLNPIYYQLPSFWSGQMHAYFQKKLQELFELIEKEIGEKFEIVNRMEADMSTLIDQDQINWILKDFINDPARYYKEHRISFFDTAAEEKRMVDKEYMAWKKVEEGILSGKLP